MKENKKVTALYSYEQKTPYTGSLSIWGVTIPCDKVVYNPLEKIWASVKKKVLEEYGVHISATFKFTYPIICDFMIDTAYAETAKISKPVLCYRFKTAFPLAMSKFEDALEEFFEDTENGFFPFADYCVSTKGKPDREKCEEMLNNFLRNINLRNPVEKYSQEELQLIKEERLRRKEEKKLRKEKGFIRQQLLKNAGELCEENGRVLSKKEISDLAEARAREKLRIKDDNKEVCWWAFYESFN